MGRLLADAVLWFVALLGMICGTVCVSFIGLLSIVSPNTADKMFQDLQSWSNEE